MGLKPDGRGTINKNHAFGTYHILKMGLKVLAMCLHQSHFKIGFLLIPMWDTSRCVEATTSKRLWLEKLSRHHHASPALRSDLLLIPDDTGIVWTVKAAWCPTSVERSVGLSTPPMTRHDLSILPPWLESSAATLVLRSPEPAASAPANRNYSCTL